MSQIIANLVEQIMEEAEKDTKLIAEEIDQISSRLKSIMTSHAAAWSEIESNVNDNMRRGRALQADLITRIKREVESIERIKLMKSITAENLANDGAVEENHVFPSGIKPHFRGGYLDNGDKPLEPSTKEDTPEPPPPPGPNPPAPKV